MSGHVRTLEKRMLKRIGYARQTQKLEMFNGLPRLVALKRGEGEIMNPDGTSSGRRVWPHLARGARRAAVDFAERAHA